MISKPRMIPEPIVTSYDFLHDVKRDSQLMYFHVLYRCDDFGAFYIGDLKSWRLIIGFTEIEVNDALQELVDKKFWEYIKTDQGTEIGLVCDWYRGNLIPPTKRQAERIRLPIGRNIYLGEDYRIHFEGIHPDIAPIAYDDDILRLYKNKQQTQNNAASKISRQRNHNQEQYQPYTNHINPTLTDCIDLVNEMYTDLVSDKQISAKADDIMLTSSELDGIAANLYNQLGAGKQINHLPKYISAAICNAVAAKKNQTSYMRQDYDFEALERELLGTQ